MIASILETAYPGAVLATRGTFNNDIGLPLTLLGLHAGHRAAVVQEMGMNQPGVPTRRSWPARRWRW